jgi:DNA-binding CsgD family transcriptional regulator/PAS domain-containing protein
MYSNPEEIFGGTSKLLALIELIYGAVDDVSLWPVVLDQIAAALQSEETLIWTTFSGPAVANIMSSARMDERALEPYAKHYASVNVLAEKCDLLYQDGKARYSHRAVPDVEFETTEFYNDYFKPNGMHYSLGLRVPLGDQSSPYFACMRPKHKGPFEDAEGTALETLMPHLRRALKLHLQTTRLRSSVDGLEFALDAFDHAVFGLDRDGVVILCNRRAEDMVKRGDGIKLVNGRLAATRIEENDLLQSQLAAAVAAGTLCGTSSGGSLLLSRKADSTPLRLTVTPFQSNLLDGYGRVAAMVFVSDPATELLPRHAILHKLYRLTPTEGRIADLLASGHEIDKVVDALGITLETARFHVKRILSKTGTHRQIELIRLILSLPGCAEIPFASR